MRVEAQGRAVALAALAVAAACAVNPATGRRQLSLIGEQREIEIGREADREVRASMGRYDDPGLESYVREVGRRLASVCERPDLEWHFQVVDDPVVNAFALPGGYVYLTRGILAHLGSEAELAAVMGHEIGHVTARHSVNQMTKARLTTWGLGIGEILSPEIERFGQIAETGLGLLFLKFSRDDERQADDLGLRYMVAAGYDPRPMADVFELLRRVSESGGSGRVPGWASTHPIPENRKERTEQALDRLAARHGRVDRDDYLDHIDGIVFGDDPRQGYFEDHRFYHPALRFRLEFPAGWKTANRRDEVLASNDAQDAVVRVTLASGSDPAEAAREFFAQQGMSEGTSWIDAVHGLPAMSRRFEAVTTGGTLRGVAVFVGYGGRVFRIVGLSTAARWQANEDAVLASLRSFRELKDPVTLGVRPARLEIVTLAREQSVAQVAESYHASVPVETLALVNRLRPGERVESGTRVKIVTGGRLP